MIYNLAKSTPSRIRFFNTNVFPHSLGPDIIHLNFSGNMAAFFIFLLYSHDCRLSLTSISKSDSPLMGEGGLPTEFSPTMITLSHIHCKLGLSLCLALLNIISSSLSSLSLSSNKMVLCLSLPLTMTSPLTSFAHASP